MYRSTSIEDVGPDQSSATDNLVIVLGLELPWISFLAVLLLLPGRFLSLSWQPLLVMALFVFWPLHWVMKRQHANRYLLPRIMGWCLGLLLIWLPVNLLISVKPSVSWEAIGYLLLGLTYFTACINNTWLQKRPLRLAWGFLIMGSLLALVAPLLVNWKSEFRLFYLPFYDWFAATPGQLGETIHPNIIAGTLVMLTLVIIGVLLPPKYKIEKVEVQTVEGTSKVLELLSHQKLKVQILWTAYLLGTLLMCSLLLLTQSRGAYLGLLVAVPILLILRWPRLGYAIPGLMIAIGFIIYKIDLWQIFELIGADNTLGGAEWRSPIWSASLRAFQDFSWTGIGLGNFQQVMPILYPSPAINHVAATHSHNLLIQISLDLGLPGFIAYIIFFIATISMAISVLHRTGSPSSTAAALGAIWGERTITAPSEVGISISNKRFIHNLIRLERTRQQHWALAAGCLAALVGMQVHGLLDAVTWGNKLAFIPWLIFAQITLLYHYQNEQ